MARKNRWEYLNDYQKNESGEYEYKGGVYAFAADDDERRKAYVRLWAALTVTAASCVASGCLSGAGITNTFYVILPYIGEIASLFALMWYHIKLLTKGAEVKAYIYKSTQPKIPVASMLVAFFAIVGFAMSLVFSFVSHFEDGVLNAVLYLVLKAVSAAASLLYRNKFSKLEWIEI